MKIIRQSIAKHAGRILHAPRSETKEARTKINLRKKLDDIMENNGEMLRHNRQSVERIQKQARDDQALSRAYNTLRRAYDSVTFIDKDGKPFSVDKLRMKDLKFRNKQSRLVFDNVMRVKDMTKKQVNRGLAMTLLGTNQKQLDDPYFVTKNVVDLLAFDQDAKRANYLCRITPKNAIVAMNTIMEWHFDRKDQKRGIKSFNERRDFGVPCDSYTYLKFFDGVAKTSEWGKVGDVMCDRMIETFKSARTKFFQDDDKMTTSVFNACLSILVKNFAYRQVKAWSFFDELIENKELGIKGINPDAQTFTILLQGLRKYSDHEKHKILTNTKLSSHERIVKLLDLEAGHIKAADIIFEKVKTVAAPPAPTSSPEQDKKNIAKWRKNRLEIDFPLITTYVSSFCSRDSGTGLDLKSGSHYLYNEKTLEILRSVSSEVEAILSFLEQDDGGKVNEPITASSKVKEYTDLRIKSAVNGAKNTQLSYVSKIDELIPTNVVKELGTIPINPQVYIPYLDKFKSFSEPLIDFKRDWSIFENPSTKAKKSKDELERAEQRQYSVNAYILNQVFDSLINMGKFKQFVQAFWFSMIQWGGVRLYTADLKKYNVLDDFLNKAQIRKHQDARVPSIIDDVMFNSFIYKVAEHGRVNGSTRSNLVLEMFAALTYSKYRVGSIEISQNHIDHICSTLVKDLHYYNDSIKKKQYSTKPHITQSQLREFLNNLNVFGQVHAAYMNKSQLIVASNAFYQFMDKVNKTLLSANWVGVDNDRHRLHFYKLLIRASIRYYKPRFMVSKTDPKTYCVSIETAVKESLKIINGIENLDGGDKKLRIAFKRLLNLKVTELNKEQYEAFLKDIYQLIDLDESNTVTHGIGELDSRDTCGTEASDPVESDKTDAVKEAHHESQH
ncbi:hypothetical protein KGF57_003985 [Candida theae]|uniref:Mitochondrial group I intron splicing factor CCM1 n=1 Tax=Candida theae TaxID=1198502 RepID=A0AAD5FX99_9ASCO|nr:uncharacterized protein KGF57_003985 [Candida theae]KAI5953776.1 hypothetical protein KGF57_003985 [Candida theae]